jgi:hypothetical protein
MKHLLLILTLGVTMLFTTTHAMGQTNIALGKVTAQSADGTRPNGMASSAVDGNTDGNFFNGSVTHTASMDYPWWRVDLGADHQIDEIRIWNRTDCCAERLNDLIISVLDANQNVRRVLNYPSATNPIIIPLNITGQYVTLSINKENAFLSLAEVEVFGSPLGKPAPVPTPVPQPLPTPRPAPMVPLVNLGRDTSILREEESRLAENQTIFFLSRQSSTFAGGGGYRDNAVDGNRDGDYSNGSVTHTELEYQPFWEADLRYIQDIREIRIYNRTDCCSERLDDFIIIVSENPIKWNTDGTVYDRGGYIASPLKNPFIFKKSVRARYVRIYLVGTGYLSLAEVEIMGIDNSKCIQSERGVCVQREN